MQPIPLGIETSQFGLVVKMTSVIGYAVLISNDEIEFKKSWPVRSAYIAGFALPKNKRECIATGGMRPRVGKKMITYDIAANTVRLALWFHWSSDERMLRPWL